MKSTSSCLKTTLFLILLSVSSLTNAQVFSEEDKIFQGCKKVILESEQKDDPIMFRDFLFNLIIHTRNSSISLKDLRFLIQESERLIKDKPAFKKQEFLLFLVKGIVEDYSGRHLNFLKIVKETKEQLLKDEALSDLLLFNLEAAHFLRSNGYYSEAKVLHLDNERFLKQVPVQNQIFVINKRAIENACAMGVLYQTEQNLDSSEWYFKLALDRSIQAKDTTWIGINSGNVGFILFKKGKIHESEPYILLDKLYSIKGGVYTSALNAQFTLIDIKIKQQDFKEAQRLLDEALVLREKVKNPEKNFIYEFNNSYETRLAKLLFQSSKLNEAVNLFNQVIDAQEARAKQNHVESLSPDRNRYAIEENVLRIEALEKQKRFTFYLSLLIVLFLTFSIVFIYFQFKHAQKLKAKNAEIGNQAKDLAALNAQKNKLFSILSHDLRSPLGNLHNLLEMQKEGDLKPEEFHKFIPIISDSLKSVSSTLENLLSWTKIGMKSGIQMQANFIAITPLLVEIEQQIKPLLEAKEIRLKVDNKLNGLVWADPGFLLIVLRNLLSNAIKFSHAGKEVLIEIEPKVENTKVAIIRITDHGVGISKEAIEEVFAVKSNYKKSVGTAGEQGSGLGLIICKEFTEAMGGKIYASSIPQVGSTFYIELPCEG
jgi:signal transduction histidine kinase